MKQSRQKTTPLRAFIAEKRPVTGLLRDLPLAWWQLLRRPGQVFATIAAVPRPRLSHFLALFALVAIATALLFTIGRLHFRASSLVGSGGTALGVAALFAIAGCIGAAFTWLSGFFLLRRFPFRKLLAAALCVAALQTMIVVAALFVDARLPLSGRFGDWPGRLQTYVSDLWSFLLSPALSLWGFSVVTGVSGARLVIASVLLGISGAGGLLLTLFFTHLLFGH